MDSSAAAEGIICKLKDKKFLGRKGIDLKSEVFTNKLVSKLIEIIEKDIKDKLNKQD